VNEKTIKNLSSVTIQQKQLIKSNWCSLMTPRNKKTMTI